MNPHSWLIVICVLAISPDAWAQELPVRFPSKPRPITQLPPTVTAPSGELTLHAAHDTVHLGKVVLYLVNRTGEDLVLPAQDGQPYVFLETRDEHGDWVRAQSHRFSWCGNSYMRGLRIPPEAFVIHGGWRAGQGAQQTVRYRLYTGEGIPSGWMVETSASTEAISNAGRGVVDADEIIRARYDALSMARAGVDRLAEGLTRLSDPRDAGVERAFHRLHQLPPDDARRCLLRVMGDPGVSPSILRLARSTLGQRDPHFDLASDPTFDRIRTRALDPETPDGPASVLRLAETRVKAAKGSLQKIADDRNYPEATRSAAHFALARCFGEVPVEVRIHPQDTRRRGARPVFVQVTNKSGETLRFHLRHAAEVIRLHVQTGATTSGDAPLLESRRGPDWFPPPTGDRGRRIEMEPGATMDVDMELTDYFDLPDPWPRDARGQPQPISVWASFRLPGDPATPRLSLRPATIRR